MLLYVTELFIFARRPFATEIGQERSGMVGGLTALPQIAYDALKRDKALPEVRSPRFHSYEMRH